MNSWESRLKDNKLIKPFAKIPWELWASAIVVVLLLFAWR